MKASTRSASARFWAPVGLLVIALLFCSWWVLHDKTASAAPEALSAPTAENTTLGELPVPAERDANAPELLDQRSSSVEPPTVELSAASHAGSLVITVRHAHGPQAGHGIVAVYTTLDERLTHAELDENGRWEHAGFDHAVEVYIIGLSADFGRLSLDVGRGAHEVVLPEGAWLTGHVTVDGAPPGKRFTVNVRDVVTFRDLPDLGIDLRRMTPDREVYARGGSVYTAPDGSFLVSGFAAESEVRVGGPGEPYVRVAEASSPTSVPVPYDGYVLALRRQPVVRGRVLRVDGSPAADAVLKLSQRFTRLVPAGSALQILETINSSGGELLNERGEFEIPLGDLDSRCRCLDPVSETMLEDEACGPLELVLGVLATHSSGESVEAEQRTRRLDQDIDFGDLWMVRQLTHQLRILDSRGNAVRGAKFELESSDSTRAWMASLSLRSDDDGLVSFLAEDADAGAVNVSAERHESLRVELPAVPQSTPIDVLLSNATMLTLNVAWPPAWDTEDVGKWYVELSGTAPVLRDPGRRKPIVRVKSSPRSAGGGMQRMMRASDVPPGEPVTYEIDSVRDSVLIDGLQSQTALHLRLHSRHPLAQSEGEPAPDITYWESVELWLERGEHRVIDVDVSAHTEDPPGDGG